MRLLRRTLYLGMEKICFPEKFKVQDLDRSSSVAAAIAERAAAACSSKMTRIRSRDVATMGSMPGSRLGTRW